MLDLMDRSARDGEETSVGGAIELTLSVTRCVTTTKEDLLAGLGDGVEKLHGR